MNKEMRTVIQALVDKMREKLGTIKDSDFVVEYVRKRDVAYLRVIHDESKNFVVMEISLSLYKKAIKKEMFSVAKLLRKKGGKL